MKKFVCGLLLFVVGIMCSNIGIISTNNNVDNDKCNEINYFEEETPKLYNKRVKKSARAEVVSSETAQENNYYGYADLPDSVYLVIFDCCGGTYDNLSTFRQTVNCGTLLPEPDSTKLIRNNCKFLGWYTEDDKRWNFDRDIVNEDIFLKAKWKWDCSKRIEDFGSVADYLFEKYPSTVQWWSVAYKSSDFIPIEVQGNDFPKSDIQTAIYRSGVESSYGGCGPLAMMGIMDYFARYLGYTSIMNDVTDSQERISLAYQILKNTGTIEMANTYSSGNKSTITFPGAYASAFDKLIKDYYNLDKQIVAGRTFDVASKSDKINRVKQSIDEGLPVTVYVSFGGEGIFANHYVNVYSYETFEGTDSNGNVLTQTIFQTRVNWGWDISYGSFFYDCHMDADLLGKELTSGVIYYTVKDNNQLIRPSDFSKAFVNKDGKGQYFFYDKSADITLANGFHFGTSRLRCGYIDNKYLVLSADRANAGLAYLEMNFDVDIKAMNLDISLWGNLEGVLTSIQLFYVDKKGVLHEYIDFDPFEMSRLREYPDNYYISFPEPVSEIRIEVYQAKPSGDRNKGRVVIGDMNLFY